MIIVNNAGVGKKCQPNSLFGLLHHVDGKAEVIKVDVRLSKDEVPMLYGGEYLSPNIIYPNSCIDAANAFNDKKYLQRIDRKISNIESRHLEGLGIATLEQAFILVNIKKTLLLDVKDNRACDSLISLLKKYKQIRVILASYNPNVLMFFSYNCPQYRRVLIMDTIDNKIMNLCQKDRKYSFQALIVDYEKNATRDIMALRYQGHKVYLKTINDKKTLYRYQVNGYMTDYPARFGFSCGFKLYGVPILPCLWLGEQDNRTLRHYNTMHFVSTPTNQHRYEFKMKNYAQTKEFMDKLLRGNRETMYGNPFGRTLVFMEDSKQGRKFLAKYLKNILPYVKSIFYHYDNWHKK